METRIEIRTVKGYAKSTQNKLKPFILGARMIEHEVYTNEADDKIVWIVKGNTRRIMKINRNVAKFDVLMKKVLMHKTLHRVAKLNREQINELKEMFDNHTTVKVIKYNEYDDTMQEMTLWEKLKRAVGYNP